MRFQLNFIVWKERFAEKIEQKHRFSMDEVEEALFSNPHVRLAEKGRVKGENVFVAYGRAQSGRYLVVVSSFGRRMQPPCPSRQET